MTHSYHLLPNFRVEVPQGLDARGQHGKVHLQAAVQDEEGVDFQPDQMDDFNWKFHGKNPTMAFLSSMVYSSEILVAKRGYRLGVFGFLITMIPGDTWDAGIHNPVITI